MGAEATLRRLGKMRHRPRLRDLIEKVEREGEDEEELGNFNFQNSSFK
jgi:hypothetical protein